jgi:hypothetical protein
VKNLWNREPAAVLAALQALIAVAVSFGLSLSAEQVGGILAATAAVLGLITRSQVSPTDEPKD